MMLVRHIKNGTVVDHIKAGKGLGVMKLVKGDTEDPVVLAMNVSSTRHGKKDILKLENVYLDEDTLDLVSLLAPNATVNLIKEGEVEEKRKVKLPSEIKGVLKCFNPKCITNQEREPAEPEFKVLKNPVRLKCKYCGEVFAEKFFKNVQKP